ncbi:MAG: 5-(carboxyamino)imidazole ribonucleotide synthase [Flammeovirgaceae bacterium]|jgi:5-(carboxyamino)imidazole ribonucleotide synthase|nr:5-(carboxyamino)imidazole ribonucleotide synthase [Flammeovirgaceae bacterium]
MPESINQCIGILGGGQLGRMLIQSGIDFNIHFSVLDPDATAPCHSISTFTHGKLTDYQTVVDFGRTCDLITIEIENVNVLALKALVKQGKKVFPQPEVIELIQDKRTQKEFYKTNGIPTAEFILTSSRQDVIDNKSFLPAVNKLGKEGYDGRGVQLLRTENDLEKAFDAPGLLEKLIDFEKEIAVIVARSESGEVVSYPAVEMVFHPTANLVEYLFSPAAISLQVAMEANAIARSIIEKLEMVGLLAVEMFVTKEGKVLVNEIAPRPHNSGHQTIEANATSQYEQHLRAILDLPLGSTAAYQFSAMVNLLGEEGYSGEAKYDGLAEVLQTAGTHIHLYGKRLTKPFRKMGHVTILDEDIESLKKKANFVKQTLKVVA